MGTIYLVRHAHADWTTDEKRRLSPKGEEDSNHVAEILQIFPINAIYSSPFNRAYETILPLSKRLNIPIISEPNLRERSVGASTITDFNKSVEALWRDPGLSYPEGESNIVAQQRGIEVIQRLHLSNLTGQIVISTHGNLLALILNYYNNKVDYEFWKTLTNPDIFGININIKEEVSINRLWKEK
jgi:2,3-bisphosphoglycerate-dependent phosphoglycerate mutase